MITRSVSYVLLTLGTLAIAQRLYAQEARDVARKSLPSVVLLTMQDAHGQPLALGSGFFVDTGVVATSFHVVEGASHGIVKAVGKEDVFSIKGIVGLDAARDLVLLAVEDNAAKPLTLADSSVVEVGDTVYAIGNPEGLEGTFSQGIVSGRRNVGEDVLLQITAPISPGSSGGPVVNGAAHVVGVAVATFTTGQSLNFAIPSEYLRSLLNRKTPLMPLRKQATARQEKSIISEIGEDSTAAITVSHFKLQHSGWFSFSVRNSLAYPVTNVVLFVVFFDEKHDPVDSTMIKFGEGVTILPGTAKRRVGIISGSSVEFIKSHEFRVLGFDTERR